MEQDFLAAMPSSINIFSFYDRYWLEEGTLEKNFLILCISIVLLIVFNLLLQWCTFPKQVDDSFVLPTWVNFTWLLVILCASMRVLAHLCTSLCLWDVKMNAFSARAVLLTMYACATLPCDRTCDIDLKCYCDSESLYSYGVSEK